MIPVDRKLKTYSAPKLNLNIEFFSDDELKQIFDWIFSKYQEAKTQRLKKYYKKYYLLIKILLWTGARIDEALVLRPIDINFDVNTITLITLKKKNKNAKRILPIHYELKSDIMQYYIDNNINKNSQDKLFSITRQSVNAFFKKMEKDLKFRIHAHKFRHTFAVKAVMSNIPLNVLQQWLGHSSIFTTSIYTQITGIDTSQFMNQVH
jgi:integrase